VNDALSTRVLAEAGTHSEKAIVSKIVQILRQRSERLRVWAFMNLILILGAIALGIALFYFAGQISVLEAPIVSVYKELHHELQDLSSKLSGKESVPQGDLQEVKVILDGYKTSLDTLLHRSLEVRIAAYNSVLISTVATRAGSVMILLFLVQILVVL
jgi:hypothetical protein